MGGRLLLALEGGYEAKALRECIGEVVQALTDPEELVGGRDGTPEPFATPPPWLEPLAPIARSAIHAARAAHKALPLRLMEGYSAMLRPFAAPRFSLAGDTGGPSAELSITGVAGGTVASTRSLPSRAKPPSTGKRPGSPLPDSVGASCNGLKRRWGDRFRKRNGVT